MLDAFHQPNFPPRQDLTSVECVYKFLVTRYRQGVRGKEMPGTALVEIQKLIHDGLNGIAAAYWAESRFKDSLVDHARSLRQHLLGCMCHRSRPVVN